MALLLILLVKRRLCIGERRIKLLLYAGSSDSF
jgi:hypothetical protein